VETRLNTPLKRGPHYKLIMPRPQHFFGPRFPPGIGERRIKCETRGLPGYKENRKKIRGIKPIEKRVKTRP